MADRVIGDYTAAVSIDGSTHYLLIQPGDASTQYNRINRDVFLGVTGQPADISSVQNLTNKSLDNSNTIVARDDRFTLQDNLDTTKQAQFQLSGLTTATTRTYTFPDANTTLVGTGTTQTLTSKTLTAPAITGGTIANSTITVDSIGEFSAGNGVTVDGLNIKDGALNTANSVVTSNITDSAVTPAKLQTGTGAGWAWQSWTPTWTNLTVSGSTVTARYIQIGKTVVYRISVVLGGGNAPSGSVSFTLPVTSVSYAGTATIQPIGMTTYFDVSTGSVATGDVGWQSTTQGNLHALNAGVAVVVQIPLSSTSPFTWANSDELQISGTYEAA